MLQNEREVQNTKIQIAKMEQALVDAQEKMAARSDLPAIVREGHLNGIRARIGAVHTPVVQARITVFNFPITSAHLCAASLQRLNRLDEVAFFVLPDTNAKEIAGDLAGVVRSCHDGSLRTAKRNG